MAGTLLGTACPRIWQGNCWPPLPRLAVPGCPQHHGTAARPPSRYLGRPPTRAPRRLDGSCWLTMLPLQLSLGFSPSSFHILLSERPRLPLPLTARTSRCHRDLDTLGDHRAACTHSGTLCRRGCALERAAATVWRQAGPRAAANMRLADLGLVINRLDDRGLEVVARPSTLGRCGVGQWTAPWPITPPARRLSRGCAPRCPPPQRTCLP